MNPAGASAALLVAFALITAPALAQDAPDFERLREEFQDSIARTMRKERMAGLSVAVVHGREVVWRQGFGVAQRDPEELAGPATRYELGDISMAVTALAVMRLVEQGRVDLDADVRDYLPDLRIDSRFPARPVTLRQLLTHHAGVVSNRWQGHYRAEPVAELLPITEVFLSHPPGVIYAYSSRGFQLAGLVVERVAGVPFGEFVRRQVLTPLGMSDAHYDAQPVATSYDSRRALEPSYPRDLAARGLRGSVDDLARLAIAMIDPATSGFEPSSIQEMQRPQNADVPLDLDNRTGLAWQLTNAGDYRVDRVLRLNNAGLGYSGVLLIAPQEEVAVALLSNAADSVGETVEIGRDLFDAAIEAATGRSRPDRDDFEMAPAPLPEGAEPSPMAEAYVSALGLMAVTPDGDTRFDVRFLGRNFRFIETPSGWYRPRYRLLRILSLSPGILDKILLRPARIANREVMLVQFRQQIFVIGARHEYQPAEPDIAQLAGRYRLTNPDWFTEKLELDTLELSADEQGLFATYRLPFFFRLEPRVPLVPLDDDRLVIPGLGTNQGEPVTIENAGPNPTLSYSGYRFTRD